MSTVSTQQTVDKKVLPLPVAVEFLLCSELVKNVVQEELSLEMFKLTTTKHVLPSAEVKLDAATSCTITTMVSASKSTPMTTPATENSSPAATTISGESETSQKTTSNYLS